jgi:hypothetical protein
MHSQETLYLAPEDLYRVGNSTSPQMTKVRPDEITIQTINGIDVIIADDKGISLYNKAGIEKAPLTGWIYEIRANTPFPSGLKLVPDSNLEGHYFVCPMHNMPLKAYVGLLEQMAFHCEKVFRKRA